MRILVITHNFPNEGNPNHGIFAARQIEEMIRQGNDVTVLAPVVWRPPFAGWFKRWETYNHKWMLSYNNINAISVPFLRLPGRWFRNYESKTLYYSARNTVIRLHHKKNFDLIYARFLHPEGYAAARLAKILRIPVVGVGAGDEINVYPNQSKKFKKQIIKTILMFDGLISSGKEVAGNIKRMTARDAMAIGGVVDLNEFCPVANKDDLRRELGLPLDKFIVLYMGTFKTAKGVFEMIDAFVQVHPQLPDAKLAICGYGPEEGAMLNLINNSGACDYITMYGMVPADKVSRWMQASDIFVLASHAEGMPNAVMEAMACGLPVLVTRVGGLKFELNSCEGAVLVEPRATDQLAISLVNLFKDESLYNKMQIKARDKAVKCFDVKQNTTKVLEYLSEVVRRFNIAE